MQPLWFAHSHVPFLWGGEVRGALVCCLSHCSWHTGPKQLGHLAVCIGICSQHVRLAGALRCVSSEISFYFIYLFSFPPLPLQFSLLLQLFRFLFYFSVSVLRLLCQLVHSGLNKVLTCLLLRNLH